MADMARVRRVFAHVALALALLALTGPAAASFVRAPRAPEPESDYIRAVVPVGDSGLAIVQVLAMVVTM